MWGYSIIQGLYLVYIHRALTILLGLFLGFGSKSRLKQSLTGTVGREAGGNSHSRCSSLC